MARLVRVAHDVKPGDPTAIGPYRVLRRLGQGGMGVVYLVEDPRTGARLALKTLRAGADLEARRRFAREAEAMARVDDHPHVLRVHSAGEHERVPYLVMAHAPGGDLAARLQGGPLAPAEVARLGVALARGLAHVHAQGVLHRDLKPSNVLFDEHDAPRLVDFGLARLVEGERLTQTGTIVGTPAYMAPEQADGRPDLDARADVYGLGALLYHALTGKPPFQGASAWAVLDRVLREPPAPPRQLVPGVPAALEAVVLRALAKSPADRFPSAEALAAALEAAGAAPTAPRRRRAWLAAAGLVVLVGALALALRRGAGPPSPSTVPPGDAPDDVPPGSSDPAHDLAQALADLRAERTEAVLALAAARAPRAVDDPLAAVVAAAADLSGGAPPDPWRAAVAHAREAPDRDAARLRRLTGELLAELTASSAGPHEGQQVLARPREGLQECRKLLDQLRATRQAAGPDAPASVVAATVEVQRALATRFDLLVELTSNMTGSSRRGDRQALVRDLLRELAALEPDSLTAVALRVMSCVPAVGGVADPDASWALLDDPAVTSRQAELQARYPRVWWLPSTLWLALGPSPLLAERWDDCERRWADVRRTAAAFDGDQRLVHAAADEWDLVPDAARHRAEAAMWRAWARRAAPADLTGALRDARAAAEVFRDVDPAGHALHAARLHLLGGDGPAALEALDAVPTWPTRGLTYLAARLRIDGELLTGHPVTARQRLADLPAPGPDEAKENDPAFWCGVALTMALLDAQRDARAALDRAAEREAAFRAKVGLPYCPWWSVAEATRAVAAASDRGWTPDRTGRLYLLPGE